VLEGEDDQEKLGEGQQKRKYLSWERPGERLRPWQTRGKDGEASQEPYAPVGTKGFKSSPLRHTGEWRYRSTIHDLDTTWK
jgi:hypothetical protein